VLCSITAILVGNCGLGAVRFAELAGAGVRACGVPSHAGAAYKYWPMPGRRKIDQCRILCGLGVANRCPVVAGIKRVLDQTRAFIQGEHRVFYTQTPIKQQGSATENPGIWGGGGSSSPAFTNTLVQPCIW
jgi:hypothetical protein